MKIIFALLIVTNVMYSQIKNNLNQQVESLNRTGFILQLSDDGAGGLLIAGTNGTFDIPLSGKTIYEIHRIDLIVSSFIWVIPPAVVQGIAYPKWEQFSISIKLAASIRDPNGSTIRQKLFNDLLYTTPDGITSTKLLYEPFVFETDINNDNILYISTTEFQSTIESLTGITLPPPSGSVFVRASIFLEGVSYPNPDKQIFQRHSK